MNTETKSFVAGLTVGASAVVLNRKGMDNIMHDGLIAGKCDLKTIGKTYGKLFLTAVAGGAALDFAVSNKVTYALGAYCGACCAMIPVAAGMFRPSLDDVARKAAMDF